MRQEWLVIKSRSAGFSAVEALLAATVFGMLVAAIGGALIFARSSAGVSGDRARAVALAEEGLEATRNIRDGAYTNLNDGTFGLMQASGQWVFSGTSDTNGMYTRQVSVASNGPTRKTITSKVTWPSITATSEVTLTSQLTNWMASIAKLWTNPQQTGALDIVSTNDGVKVATQGNYAYLVRSSGMPDFAIINIGNPASPTLVGSLSLSGNPTNIAVNGNYVYVTNTANSAELQIVDVTNPTTPLLRGSYDAPGAADGTSIYVNNNTAYMTRKANGANNEFVIVNVTTPTAPTRTTGYNLNVNMNGVYVNDGNFFIVTDSDTQEIIELTHWFLGILVIDATINLPGTANAATVAGFDNTLVVGQGGTVYTIDGGVANSVLGSVTLSGAVNDLAVSQDRNYAYAGTSATGAEFQVVSISNLASPSFVKSVDIAGTASTLTGVAYNASLDVVTGASASDTQEFIVFGPG